ncbi:PDDEXK nuclease domain-containing protein [Agriterribacter sp.]|uniref:PDDEXK nuclease domain-containing protein n=1 Tax=Agriterribacter sp. TaxID=2821509 RepID=UPI002C243B0A|nr:PDDEXK nuclease domain-containing protein [Agriterribacter sp.]HRP56750.1 PDDEXK nuclease domain-containing protein [Agriterribacter sp.]
MKNTTKQYREWLVELKRDIQNSKLQAVLQVNQHMLLLYWYLGKQITQKVDVEGWGAKIIPQLAKDLQKQFPDLQGFSARSLKYMRQFANAYPDLLIGQQPAAQLQSGEKTNSNRGTKVLQRYKKPIGQQAAAQFNNKQWFLSNPLLVSIPWGHHMFLLDKIFDGEARLWYIQKTIEHNWSRAVLQYQVQTDLFQRQKKNKKHSNFHLTLPKPQSDLANQVLKDPYIFNFLDFGEKITEHELEKQLINHIQEFLIELGAGFAFVGRQIKFKIGRKDHFIDLLFYHLILRSYVVLELKMEGFELAHTGQMNGYLNFINEHLKQATDNPSIGIILCGSKDEVEVDFALSNINHPIGVSDYRFIKSLPRQLRGKLPDAKALQNEIKKFLGKNRRSKK